MAKSLGMKIADEVKALLTVPPMVSVAVADVRTEPIHPVDLLSSTAINVELGDEPPTQPDVIGMKEREIQVKLTIMATGADAVAAADEVLVEAHALLMTDRTLGGLAFDIKESSARRMNQLTGQRLAVIEKIYLVDFRTTETSLEN
jgi:hypothetical protein